MKNDHQFGLKWKEIVLHQNLDFTEKFKINTCIKTKLCRIKTLTHGSIRKPMYIDIRFCSLLIFLNSVLRPFQIYFSSYETGQSVGGAKTGEPREKTPDTPASRTWLVSHVTSAGLEPTPDTAVRSALCCQAYTCTLAATRETRSSWFPTRSNKNRPVQSKKQARSLKFRSVTQKAIFSRCGSHVKEQLRCAFTC